jgi:hypothetical protein
MCHSIPTLSDAHQSTARAVTGIFLEQPTNGN